MISPVVLVLFLWGKDVDHIPMKSMEACKAAAAVAHKAYSTMSTACIYTGY